MKDSSGLEVHVSAAEGFHLEESCFVAVKLGDVLKQGRYKPDRPYRFPPDNGPAPQKPRIGRIDLFKQIGSCRIEASAGEHEVWVESSDPSDKGQMMKLKLRVAVGKQGEPVVKSTEVKEKAEQARDARVYLKDSNIEEMLSDAVKAVLRERPDNARQFVVDHLLAKGSDMNLTSASVKPVQPPQPPLPPVSPQPQRSGGDFQLRPAQAQQRIKPQLAPIEGSESQPPLRPLPMQSPTDGYDILGSSPSRTPKDTEPAKAPAKPSPSSRKQPPEPEPPPADNKQAPEPLKKKAAQQEKEAPKEMEQKVEVKPGEQAETKQVPADAPVQAEAVRVKANHLLLGALQDGSLDKAVQKSQQAELVKNEPKQDSQVTEDGTTAGLDKKEIPQETQAAEEPVKGSARDKLQGLMSDALDDGNLDDIISNVAKETEENAKKVNQAALKVAHAKARASFAGAAHSGKLETALSSLRFIAGLEASRKKVQGSLAAAVKNGKLSDALNAASK